MPVTAVVTVMMTATATTMAMGEDDHKSNVDDGGVDDGMATAMDDDNGQGWQ